MACCKWDDFEADFRTHWARAKLDPVLIDWHLARSDHRQGNTGYESAFMQAKRLREDGEYLVPEVRALAHKGGR